MYSLSSIGKRCGTDKFPLLTDVYASYFESRRMEPIRILEVGVFFGASLKMWHEYFPNGTVYGIDTFEGNQGNGHHFDNADSFLREAPKYSRMVVKKCDQSNREDLLAFASTITEPFDFIIDDGSHLMKDQQQTIGILWSLIKPGGIYFIEDYGSSYDLKYKDVKPDFSNTTATMMDRFIKSGFIKSEYITDDEASLMSEEIEKINMDDVNISSFHKRSKTS